MTILEDNAEQFETMQKQGKVVNNESSEVIRIFNSSFDDLLPQGHPSKGVTYYPAAHAKEIDGLNEWIYDKINNGVYKTGFATKQEVRTLRIGSWAIFWQLKMCLQTTHPPLTVSTTGL